MATQDTLSHFTAAACAANLSIHPLHRSNTNNIHRLIGGIYDNLIYHHAAGSRNKPRFWGEPKHDDRGQQNAQVRDAAADLLFTDYDRYLGWLRGERTDDQFAQKMQTVQRSTSSGVSVAAGPDNPAAATTAATTLTLNINMRAFIRRIPGSKRLAKLLRQGRSPGRTLAVENAKMLRPITLTDLHDLPIGWRITGPAFIGVGAPKCGTDWWYSLLVDHPQVVVNRAKFIANKELHYFVHFQSRPLNLSEIALYQQFFAAPPGAISGEFSTHYLSYPNSIEQVVCAAPDARILVILRNPIDRMLSHLNHMRVNRVHWFTDLSPEQIKLFNHWPIYYEAAVNSLYAVGLRRLFRNFDCSQVLVLQYERCCQDPAGELARTYRFLGLNDDYQPRNLQRAVNVMPYVLPRYTPEERAHLTAYFADDVQQTVELCPEIDLRLWPDFAGA